MRTKAACKAGVDIAMAVLFLGQMGYHLVDNRLHEWTGVALCLLFLAHHALNGGWHRGLHIGLHGNRALNAARRAATVPIHIYML